MTHPALPIRTPAMPVKRGYHVAYRDNEVNHCPGCGRSHWFIGRTSAECGFCHTAIPLPMPEISGAGTFWTRGKAA